MLNLLSKNNISLLRVINAVFILIVAIGTLLKYFSLKEIAEISNIVAILFFHIHCKFDGDGFFDSIYIQTLV